MTSRLDPRRVSGLLAKLAIVTFLAIGMFVYGLAVGRFEIFPYQQVVSLRDDLLYRFGGSLARLTAGRDGGAGRTLHVSTNLTPLVISTYSFAGRLDGFGGGLAEIGGRVLGVDRAGVFFRYDRAGEITVLPVALPTNELLFERKVREEVQGSTRRLAMSRYFRVQDVIVRPTPAGGAEVYVSHHHWSPEEKGKRTWVSRLVLHDVEPFLSGRLEVDGSDWEPVYKSDLIGFTSGAVSSNRSSAPMAFTDDGLLLVMLSDYGYDGVTYSDNQASQDPESSWGKAILIDPETGSHSMFARGFRNPQGLHVDREGKIWSTEHGPEGGDELNLVVEGANYGWPRVTYGTAYGSYDWPVSQEQGRHEGYDRPVFAWTPGIAVSSLIQVNRGPVVWDGDLLAGSLRTTSLYRIRLGERRVILVERIPIGERIRNHIQVADGTVLLWTERGQIIEVMARTGDEEEGPAVPFTDEELAAGLDRAMAHCFACHVDRPEAEVVGDPPAPTLWGVYGRGIGQTGFQDYSAALRATRGRWTRETLDRYLADPQDFIPGTSMPASPLDRDEREAVIEYLRRLR
jgi:cytochrome c2